MSDGIYTAETGLTAFEAGLQAISNDTSNMNTPGYKGSGVLFADLVGGNGENGEGAGEGVMTVGTAMNFSAGQLQSTGNPLDLAISGNGYFTLRDSSGDIHYTQDGQFEFNSDGVLVSSSTKEDVMALQDGKLVPISIADAQQNPAAATQNVKLSGNLLPASTTPVTVSGVTVVDSAGTTHTLTLVFTPSAGNSTSTTGTSWTVTLAPADTQTPPITLSSSPATVTFNAAGVLTSGATPLTLQYATTGSSTPTTVAVDLSGATSTSSTTLAALAFSSQNGFAPGSGTLQSETFDANGKLTLTYSGGQTVNDGPQLALANFISPDDVEASSSNEFTAKSQGVQVGVAGAGTFGTIETGEIEGSNVDLSQEFSNLVIMQRGYQACSQVISTASDMLSSLFDMVVK